MKSALVAKPLAQVETPLLAVALAQGSSLPASLADLDRAAGGVLTRAVAGGDFQGKKDELLLLYGGTAQRILLVGLGKAADVTRAAVRRAAASAAKRARGLGTGSLAFAVAAEARNGLGATDLAQVAVEGAIQGAWAFTELKKAPEDPKREVEALDLVVEAKDTKPAEAGRRIGEAIAAGYRLTRTLQHQPSNVCTPTYLAEQARQLAQTYGFTVTVLDRSAMKQEGMGALLAVAQGSQEEPRFIVLEYRGGGGGGAARRTPRPSPSWARASPSTPAGFPLSRPRTWRT